MLDEFGSVQSLVAFEDVTEAIMGLEITDELDTVEDMQILARKQWRKRMKLMSVDAESVDASA